MREVLVLAIEDAAAQGLCEFEVPCMSCRKQAARATVAIEQAFAMSSVEPIEWWKACATAEFLRAHPLTREDPAA